MSDPTVPQAFAAALDDLVASARKDTSVLAAILCGSLSHDTVWARSDIDLVFVTIDDKVTAGDLALYADGVNVHALLIPRAEFRRMIEGSLHGSFLHSFLAKGRLLYTHDQTITDLLARLRARGQRDTPILMLQAATGALAPIYKAHKWLVTRGDLDYTALWMLFATKPSPASRSSAGLLPDREVIPQAMKLNPALLKTIYSDLLQRHRAEDGREGAHDDRRVPGGPCATVFAPVIDHLREVGDVRSSPEIEDHFQRTHGIDGVTTACEYLADQGLIGKASTPVQLTRRSTISSRSWPSSPRSNPSRPPKRAARTNAECQSDLPRKPRPAALRARPSPCRARACTTSRTSRSRSRATSSIVVTGLSGSGKSSLAFDTIYAEGQRRYMESLSSYAKRFVAQVAKPDVDFVFGLSPVISIEQKTIASNPRSTVGTMTDIASYLNLLFATIGEPHCPRTGEPTPSRTASQILEAILSLPEGAGDRAARAGVQGVRRGAGLRLDRGAEEGLPAADHRRQAGGHLRRGRARRIEGPAHGRGRRPASWSAAKHEKAIKAAIAATLLVGDGLLQVQVVKGASKAERERFYQGLCSATHHFVYGDIQPEYFMFNNPESACRTCGGLGVHKLTHPELLVPDPRRSIRGGCFVREAFKYNPDTWDGRVMYSLAKALRFLARYAVGEAPRAGAPGDPERHRHRRSRSSRRRRRREAATTGRARRSASAESPGGSSGTTAATGSAARPTRGWRPGSTR